MSSSRGVQGAAVTNLFKETGFPVPGLKYGAQEDLETWITLFGTILDKSKRTEDIVSGMHTATNEVAERLGDVYRIDRPDSFASSAMQRTTPRLDRPRRSCHACAPTHAGPQGDGGCERAGSRRDRHL